jgi:hypothetical protein
MSGDSFEGTGGRITLRRAMGLLRISGGDIRFLSVLIGVPVLVILLYSFPLAQNYVVEARSLSAKITAATPVFSRKRHCHGRKSVSRKAFRYWFSMNQTGLYCFSGSKTASSKRTRSFD